MKPHADARVQRVVALFEQLVEVDVARLGEFYSDDARFKDPFNEVQGVAAIQAIFAHMFRSLKQPRFVVIEAIAEGGQCFLSWDFHFEPKRGGAPMRIHGGSLLRFAPDGRVALHRDYWDAAEELYEKLPVLGALMRWLKRQARS